MFIQIFGFFVDVTQSQLFGLNTHKLLSRSVNPLGVAKSGNAAQASTSTTQEDLLNWVKNDKRRMLHVVYRVGDLDRTIKYITFDSFFFVL